jgi:hypothetical protein
MNTLKRWVSLVTQHPWRRLAVIFGISMVLVLGLLMAKANVASASAGTTLSATKTATGHFTRTFHWTIDKKVTPDTWNLFTGDSGTSQYTIDVTKDNGTDTFSVDGEICVTNGGSVATESLSIVDVVQYKIGSGQFQDLTSLQVDLGAKTVLGSGESNCYPYTVNFTPVSGATYRNEADVTITNHSGHQPGDQLCPGPALCPFGPDPRANFSLPLTPDKLVNDTINVDDTNGQSFSFNASGSQSYNKTFACDADRGTHDNTATIRETGQKSSASVTVNCYKLGVTKDANTSLTRTYLWSITKSADQTSLTLANGQSFVVNYSVVVNVTGHTDSDWAASGTITVHNPAPIDATISSVLDAVSGLGSSITPDCGVSFPYTLAAGADLKCTYTTSLPDGSSRTNTATATLQNHSDGTASGTTDFTGSANIDFSNATITEKDKSVTVTDTLSGSLGTATFGVDTPKTFTYSHTVGPYSTSGTFTVINTATFTTKDTGATGSASWTVNVNVPSSGCTLTIGYWKTHSSKITPLLPILLGTSGGTKTVTVNTASQAVTILGIPVASNGIDKLYAQELAAKLSIANGADGSAVASTISAADTFLATHSDADWSSLTKTQQQQILSWATTLDNYNNGLTGPGHCSL